MIGRVYLERGQPVTVLARWFDHVNALRPAGERRSRGCPRNVLVERADGTKVVRPFRGLRRLA